MQLGVGITHEIQKAQIKNPVVESTHQHSQLKFTFGFKIH